MSEEKGPMILMEDVTKEFPIRGRSDPVRALRGVNLRIERGDRVAIRGPSGSGKSTLLQLLGALDVPTTGRVLLDGRDLASMNERALTDYRARTVGFVFQQFNLVANLSARENVELPLEATGVSKEERHERADKLLSQVGMGERTSHLPAKLSGGEQQRVAIARALANKPSMVLADEPTGNLDTETGDAISALLMELSRSSGVTVVVVTHSARMARNCDKRFVIRDGKIREERPDAVADPDDEE